MVLAIESSEEKNDLPKRFKRVLKSNLKQVFCYFVTVYSHLGTGRHTLRIQVSSAGRPGPGAGYDCPHKFRLSSRLTT
jgi:hypothetical protein